LITKTQSNSLPVFWAVNTFLLLPISKGIQSNFLLLPSDFCLCMHVLIDIDNTYNRKFGI
ncbi:hypothetical protein ACR8G9_22300, partial [Salmonella enterica subsp. enterica serovar Paratyphi A]